jgi:hypothetical protein
VNARFFGSRHDPLEDGADGGWSSWPGEIHRMQTDKHKALR